MVTTHEQAKRIQERRKQSGKPGTAKAVRRWMKREGVKSL